MKNECNKTNSTFDQKSAELLAQSFSGLVNTATLYGYHHPATLKYSKELIQYLEPHFTTLNHITFVLHGKSFYIEKYTVDKKLNMQRFLHLFQKHSIESISFFPEITVQNCIDFAAILIDTTLATADDKNVQLQAQSILSIKLNYVYLQKMTKDDIIVEKKNLSNSALSDTNTRSNILSNHVKRLQIQNNVEYNQPLPPQLENYDPPVSLIDETQSAFYDNFATLCTLNSMLEEPAKLS